MKRIIILVAVLSISSLANSFSDKVQDAEKVEANIEKQDKLINQQTVTYSSLVAYLLLKKSNQIFLVSKQKELLSTNNN